MKFRLTTGYSLRLIATAIVAAHSSTALAHHVTGSDTQAEQARPVKMGISVSSKTFLQIRLPYCYAGTIGALLQDSDGEYHILSNNHVLAKENLNFSYGTATENAKIIQNGLLDGCALDGDDHRRIADLADYIPIAFSQKRDKVKPENTVDAAIAKVWLGANGTDPQVDPSGEITGIGRVAGMTSAVAGMRVQKTGRTTQHNFGVVSATDITVDVQYESGIARFTNQIGISHVCSGSDFSAGGDSGSAIVSVPEGTDDPFAVGLLFAGGDGLTIANQMGAVLDSLSSSSGTSFSLVTGTDGATSGAMNTDFDEVLAACHSDGGGKGGGGKGGGGGGKPPRDASEPAGIGNARAVLAARSNQLFALPDVLGHGIGSDASGNAAIQIYLATQGRRAGPGQYPTSLNGVPVQLIQTGPIRAQ